MDNSVIKHISNEGDNNQSPFGDILEYLDPVSGLFILCEHGYATDTETREEFEYRDWYIRDPNQTETKNGETYMVSLGLGSSYTFEESLAQARAYKQKNDRAGVKREADSALANGDG